MRTQTVDTQATLLDIEAYVQRHLPQYMRELSELCAIDSNSYYKPGLDLVAEYLAAHMRRIGMEVTIVENDAAGNDLLGVLRGDGQGRVLVLGHIDTVYPVGTADSRPVRVEDDVVYGPGVCDMKGCVLSAIYAIEALVATNFRSFGEIRLLCVSDEEISQRHSEDLILRTCEGCDRALVLEAGRANGNVVSARKGSAWYTLTAKGRSAHTGVEPEKGRNAIVEIMHQMLQIQSIAGWREGLTINPGVINGGLTPNVVPDFAQARFDLRYLRIGDRIATEQRWHEMIKHTLVPDVELTLEMEPYSKEPMVCTPETIKLVRQAQEIAHMLGFSVDHELTGGASDSSFTSELGIPTLDGLGPVGGLDHSPNEYIFKSSIVPRSALLAGLIMGIDA
jgi:glutamate carboxypeptidase